MDPRTPLNGQVLRLNEDKCRWPLRALIIAGETAFAIVASVLRALATLSVFDRIERSGRKSLLVATRVRAR